MAQLAWRNVDAPDFSPAVRGYETFSNLLSQAFSGAQSGLARYDADLDKTANNNLLLKFAGIQDPEAAKAALAALGNDPQRARLSAATIDQVSGRPNALIAQALNQENLNWGQYQHTRTKGFDTAEDKTAPLYADYLAAAAAGKGQDWLANHQGFGSGLSLGAERQLSTDAMAARTGQLGNENAMLGLDRGRWDFSNAKVDRETGLAADNYVSKFISNGHTDAADLDGDPAFRALPGQTQMLIRSRLTGVGGSGMPNPVATPPGGFGTDTPGGSAASAMAGYNTVVGNGAYGSPGKNLTDMTMGQVYDFGRNTLIPNTKAKGVGVSNGQVLGSSASGMYQITGSTMQSYGQKLYGNKWRDMQFTPEVQDKIGEAIFNDNKGSAQALMGQWASLKPNEAKALVGRDWATAKRVIARGETGADPAALIIGSALNKEGSANQYLQSNAGNPIAAALGDGSAFRDTAPFAEVAAGLAKKYGMDQGQAIGILQNIANQANTGNGGIKINPRVAGILFEQSLGKNTNFFKRGWFGGALGLPDNYVNDSFLLNDKALASNIQSLRSGDYQRVRVGNAASDAQKQSGLYLEQRWRAKGAELAAAEQRAARNPNFDPTILNRLRSEYAQFGNEFQSYLNVTNNTYAGNGSFGPSAQPPVRAPARAPAPTMDPTTFMQAIRGGSGQVPFPFVRPNPAPLVPVWPRPVKR